VWPRPSADSSAHGAGARDARVPAQSSGRKTLTPKRAVTTVVLERGRPRDLTAAGTVRYRVQRGGVFRQTHDSYRFRQTAVSVPTPRLWTRHPSDPAARIFRPSLRRLSSEAARGFWAGKIAAHPAHHCFGAWGRLPHVQLNLWRVGVKGSGSAMRVPVPVHPAVLRAALLLAGGVR
jgi:hypothetical protein